MADKSNRRMIAVRPCTKPVGAGLPAMAVGQAASMVADMASSRASPLPQWSVLFAKFGVRHQFPCGSGLARDGGVSGDINVDCAVLIAGKPAPTVVGVVRKICVCRQFPCGSEPARDEALSAAINAA